MHYQIQNNQRLPVEQLPTGLLYGYGVYTSFGTPIDDASLAMHQERLKHDASVFGMTVDVALKAVIQPNFNYRVTVVPDVDHFSAIVAHKKLSALVILSEFPATAQTAKPLKLVTMIRDRPLAAYKHTSLAQALMDKRNAKGVGYDDVLYFNPDGYLTESSTANVCIIEGDRLFTPKLDCLLGITRQQLNATAADIDRDRLRKADGVFLTNAIQGIQPVIQIDDMPYVALSSWKTLQLDDTTPGSSLS